MAERTCHNCVYSVCDPGLWLRLAWKGQSLVPQCANHPNSPGRLVDVTGVPCRNYQPKPRLPHGDGVRMISLGDGYYAYVDAADYEWLSRWKWHLCSGYAIRYQKGKLVFMHREIMQAPEGMVVDHIDCNRLNNCRANLRVCTPSQNSGNKRRVKTSASGFKGVFQDKRNHKWFARCKCGEKRHLSPRFATRIEAARAYDRMAVGSFREFARLNFPEEWPPERRAEVYAQHQEQEKEEAKVRKEEGKKQESKKISPRAEPRRPRDRKRTKKSARATDHKSRATPPRPARKTAKRAAKKASARAETQGRGDQKGKAKSRPGGRK